MISLKNYRPFVNLVHGKLEFSGSEIISENNISYSYRLTYISIEWFYIHKDNIII